MSLPTSIILPKPAGETNQRMPEYLRDLVDELEGMYESLVENLNGNIRSSGDTQQERFTPVLKGDSSAGSFTYDHQSAWVSRSGIFTEVWFDVKWTASTGTGNLFLELPYKTAITSNKPFIGVVMASDLTFSTGNTSVFIIAESNTYKGNLWEGGSGNTASKIAVPSSGEIIGHLRYIGTSDE